jgi:hypothetical protein
VKYTVVFSKFSRDFKPSQSELKDWAEAKSAVCIQPEKTNMIAALKLLPLIILAYLMILKEFTGDGFLL